MKKGAVIGIVSGIVVANIVVVGLFGSYLSKAKAASTQVREHNTKVEVVNDGINATLGSKYYSASAGSNAADYDYGYEEAEYTNDAPADPGSGSGSGITNEVNVDPSKGRLLIRTVSMSAETK